MFNSSELPENSIRISQSIFTLSEDIMTQEGKRPTYVGFDILKSKTELYIKLLNEKKGKGCARLVRTRQYNSSVPYCIKGGTGTFACIE